MQAADSSNQVASSNIIHAPFNGHIDDFAKAAEQWLSVQCNMVSGVIEGAVFRVAPDGQSIRLEAAWPDSMSADQDLRQKILLCSQRGETQFEESSDSQGKPAATRLYHPLTLVGADEPSLVVVLHMEARSKEERRTVAKLLRWNSAWLQYASAMDKPAADPGLATAFTIVLACLDHKSFRAAASSLVAQLVTHFGCQRVSLGLRKGKHMQVQVLSHSARFKHETNLVLALGAAMDEAVDQDRVINYSGAPEQTSAIVAAHEELSAQTHRSAVCTIPMSVDERIIGALTLEREPQMSLSEADIRTVEHVAAILAPIFCLQQKDEQPFYRKAWFGLADWSKRLVGPAHIKLKLINVAAVCLLMFFTFAQGSWRITSDATVEGSVQRTIAAPIDGYIATVEARAGDIVKEGQRLGTLDDSDLRLQRLKWSTLRRQMLSESREATALHKRAEVSIINAKLQQADAELELIDEELSRTVLVAPYDGMVIEGDLSQLLGTPVTRGDVLFKVAPLNDYRIVINVDERDIAPVTPGQRGKLILASMPNSTLQIDVEKVTPVSTAEQGRNFFRVEARLIDSDLQLQPGMQGIAKIEVGEANLFWIWTRDMVNWLRLWVWTWWR